MGRMLELEGMRFGNLRVIARSGFDRNTRTLWRCVCDCGVEKVIRGTHLKYGSVRSCGCESHRTGSRSPRWSGYGEISGSFWKCVVHGAAARNIVVGITIRQAWNLFVRQERRCALSGLPLTFGPRWSAITASIDRIDSRKNYVRSNIQWVHKTINQMKWEFPEEHFIEVCQLVAAFNRKKGRKKHGD